MSKNMAAFILSHGRPDNVKTYRSLRRCGYTGPIYILVDNEDCSIDRYIENYGDQVIVFDKKQAAEITDAGDNFEKRNSIVYARNWNFVVAKELELSHFFQLDDDYTGFGWTINESGEYMSSDASTNRLDDILNLLVEFLDHSGAHSIAFAQGGDLIGGGEGTVVKKAREGKLLRKAMNSFVCRTDRPFKFLGRMNDDVNMFVTNGIRGNLFITMPRIRIWQTETQKSDGGLTELYKETGTYVKSFYSVMYNPSCVKITPMGSKHARLHHKVNWRNAVPKIISEEWKK